MKLNKKEWIAIGISLLAALLMGAGIAWWQSTFYGTDAYGLTMSISNGYFAVAVLYLGFSLLSWVATFGGFDALSYMFHTIKVKFSKKVELESYVVFKQGRHEKDSRRGLMVILIPGLIALLISGITCLINVNF